MIHIASIYCYVVHYESDGGRSVSLHKSRHGSYNTQLSVHTITIVITSWIHIHIQIHYIPPPLSHNVPLAEISHETLWRIANTCWIVSFDCLLCRRVSVWISGFRVSLSHSGGRIPKWRLAGWSFWKGIILFSCSAASYSVWGQCASAVTIGIAMRSSRLKSDVVTVGGQ